VVMPNQSLGTQTAANVDTEGGRRPTVVPAPTATNPEISDRPSRRTFTAPDKLRILKEADQAAGTGQIGAILRRHGLYSSALSEWRRQRDAGTLGALTPARRGPKSRPANPLAAELAVSKRQNALLRRRLERAEAIIEVQKNLPTCWGSNWRQSRQRPSSTTHFDGWTGGLHAGQGCGCCYLRGARLIPRQPAS
jgi:transposase